MSVLKYTFIPFDFRLSIEEGRSFHLGTLAITSYPDALNLNEELYHKYSLPPQADLFVETKAILFNVISVYLKDYY